MMIRKNVDPASLLLPSVNTKDIEFVIPPTRPPPSKSAQCLYIRNNNNNNVNCTKSTTRLNSTTSEESQSTPPKFSVNKGWNFIQDVMAASSALKDGSSNPGSRRASRETLAVTGIGGGAGGLDVPTIKTSRSASLCVNSLGVPLINSPAASAPGSRRGSNNSLCNPNPTLLYPDNCQKGRRSRSQSRSSLWGGLSPGSGLETPTSNPSSRRNSTQVMHEPNPEEYAQFGGINPSLYLNPEPAEKEVFPENHLGRIYYSVNYDSTSESLTVKLQRIRNLPKSTPEAGKTNKTYIKVCLLPDERSERKVTQNGDGFAELNPTFFDSIVFQAPPSSLLERTLRILVYNIDVNRKHRVLGESRLDLNDVDLTQGRLSLNADLQKFVNDSEMPEILLSVCYNSTLSRLTVNVIEAKNIKVTSESVPDTYIRLALMHQTKELKRKRTETAKKCSNPQYQESFNFRVDEKDLDSTAVKATVMLHLNFPERDKPIGFSTLGGSMFTRGKSLEHWEEVLKYQKTYIQRWHKIQDLQSESNKSSGGEGPPGNALGDGSLGARRLSFRKNRSNSAGEKAVASPRFNKRR